jgi:hypothetical protein
MNQEATRFSGQSHNEEHRFIAAPIGVVVPGELLELRPLKIVRLTADENSLAEIVAINLGWWTAKASNIMFDSDHRIQITDFYYDWPGGWKV